MRRILFGIISIEIIESTLLALERLRAVNRSTKNRDKGKSALEMDTQLTLLSPLTKEDIAGSFLACPCCKEQHYDFMYLALGFSFFTEKVTKVDKNTLNVSKC